MVYVSAEGKAYKADVLAYVLSTFGKLKPLRGRLAVTAVIHAPDNRRYDLDNRWKGILDSLKAASVIEDDWLIDDLRILRGPVSHERPRVEVSIEELPEEFFDCAVQ
jgi:Holliday junction resolvase RusA-like endonuclease